MKFKYVGKGDATFAGLDFSKAQDVKHDRWIKKLKANPDFKEVKKKAKK